jgi:hypothetical protein
LYQKIALFVTDFCEFLSDVNTLTPQELAKDDFAVIKSAISEGDKEKPRSIRIKLIKPWVIALLVLVTSAAIFLLLKISANDIPEQSPVVIANEESKKDSTKNTIGKNIEAPPKNPLVNRVRDTTQPTPAPPNNKVIMQPDSCWVYWDTRGVPAVRMSFTNGNATYTLVSDGNLMKLTIPCYLSGENVTATFAGNGKAENHNIKLNVFEMPQPFMQ